MSRINRNRRVRKCHDHGYHRQNVRDNPQTRVVYIRHAKQRHVYPQRRQQQNIIAPKYRHDHAHNHYRQSIQNRTINL